MTTRYYVQPHRSQYEPGASKRTHRSGCTWTSLANGIAATTGGRKQPTPDEIVALVPISQETNPTTPGWSLVDATKAASRYGMTLTNRTGSGFAAAITEALEGHYILLQGDSDRFDGSTCSGDFDGDHCIGWHPQFEVRDGIRWWWIDDTICPEGRFEDERVLRRYAEKFDPRVRFASFLQPVPVIVKRVPAATSPGGANVAIRYAQVTDTGSRMALPKGQALYEKPGGKRVTVMSRAATVQHVGLAGQVAGKPWRAVVVATRWSYSDGKAHRTVLYVPDNAGSVA